MSNRHDQYEGVADSYDQTFKLLPSREHVEAFSLYRLLGDLSGRSVLDLVTPRLTGIYWTLDTVASAMEEAGFSDLRWVNPEVSEQGRAQHGEAFWEDFLRKLPHIFLDCTKA